MQAISEGLATAGFSPEIRDLNFFQDDYGLKPIDGADDNDEEDSDEEDEEGEDGDENDKDESNDIDGSEGYEIVEGGEQE
jgi:hypothetical protein